MTKQYDTDKERELLIKAKQGDLFARQEVIKEYMNSLNAIIYKKNVDPNQKVAVKLEAIRLLDYYMDRWDATRANKPLTYLYKVVDQKLNRYIDDRKLSVRMVETYGQDAKKYTDSVRDLRSSLGRTPTNYEILGHMQTNFPAKTFSLKHIDRIQEGIRRSTSASNVLGSDGEATLTEMDINFLSPNESIIMDSYRRDLAFSEKLKEIDKLMEPQRSIIYYLSGINGYPKLSINAVAAKYGIKKYRVIQYRDEGLASAGMKFEDGRLILENKYGF